MFAHAFGIKLFAHLYFKNKHKIYKMNQKMEAGKKKQLLGFRLSPEWIQYFTWNWIGWTPSKTSRSKSDLSISPTLADSLLSVIGSSWCSPTRISLFELSSIGIMHSDSVAWVLSSMRTFLNRQSDRRLSPAQIQVQQTTSALLINVSDLNIY